MFDLSIVIVSWNVRDLLRCCLASLVGGAGHLSYETLVVDNASADASAAMVRSEFPNVHLIENTENLGFTRANNQALARCSGRYLVLLNPDTEIGGDALVAMASFMDANPQVGVVGPQLVFGDGRVQSSRRRFPDLKTMFVESTVLQRLFPQSALVRRYYVLDRPHDVTQDVDWVVGACMMVRREAAVMAGLLDERFFMYCEEMDWCLRMKQCGWRVVYLPAARVVHHEARSSEQAPAAKHIYFQGSKVAYAAKHFGRLQAEALRAFLLATYACQTIEEGAKWLVGHKRSLRAQRISVYRQVLASGLRTPLRGAYGNKNG
jgi:N-acetylglucosaminyl-diphospho-decaprenol L-rhamnosyltransferase